MPPSPVPACSWTSANSPRATLRRLLIAPNLFSAAVYSITGLLIHALGAQHSRLSAKNFLIFFGLLDLLAIVLQAAGAGVAAQELKNSDQTTGVGTDVMVSGICVQIVSMAAYLVLGGEFLWKSHKDPRYREREESVGDPVRGLIRSFRAGADGFSVLFFREIHGNVPLAVFGLVASTVLILLRCLFRAVELGEGYSGTLFRESFPLTSRKRGWRG